MATEDSTRNVKHGHSRSNPAGFATPTYCSWQHMIRRCRDPKESGYERYGAVGVVVCGRWLGEDGFANFLADMGERPEGATIDRFPNQSGNYEPGNCRWATRVEQQRNMRSNRLIEWDGRIQCLAAWAEELGLTVKCLQHRLNRGWSLAEAMSPAVQEHVRRDVTFNGKTQSLHAWAAEIGIAYKTLHQRLRHGWSAERALTTPV